MPDMPDQPTWADGQQAMETLDRLLESFPWQGDDDARAVGLSALITPVVRAALPTAPLHAISAPEAGTGKSYLTQVAAAIATGSPCPVISAGRNEEETEKRLAAVVLSGLTVVAIDNVSQPLGGDFLCQMLDQPRLKIRILGQSGGPTVEPRMTLFATGNNLTLVGDVVRRAVIAHMDAGLREPWTRQFQVDPLAQVMADRGRYIAAALTAVRAFLLSGEPVSNRRWRRLRRGRTGCAARSSPSATAIRSRTVATAVADDPDRQALGAMLAAWWAAFGGKRDLGRRPDQARQRARHHRRLYGTGPARRDHGGGRRQRRRHQRQSARLVAAHAPRPQAGQACAAPQLGRCCKPGTVVGIPMLIYRELRELREFPLLNFKFCQGEERVTKKRKRVGKSPATPRTPGDA